MTTADRNGEDSLHERINIRGELERIHATNAERDRRISEAFEYQENKLDQALIRLNERFEAQEKALSAARVADEKALAAALLAAEKAVQAALAAQKESAAAAVTSAQAAVDKAEQAQLRVNMTQNEFRGTLADQNATVERTMMPRAETELLIKDLRGRIDVLSGTRRQGVSSFAGALAVGASLLIALVSIVVSIAIASS